MGDDKKWFKVWTSLLGDPDFDDLPNDVAGVWIKLGALIAKHGCNGKITVSDNQFYKRTGISNGDEDSITENLKKVKVFITHDNVTHTVIIKNWFKYQTDSTGYERLKKWRNEQMITAQETEMITLSETGLITSTKNKNKNKTKTKNKEKESSITPRLKLPDEEWIQTLKENPAYKGIEIDVEHGKCLAWFQNKGIVVSRQRFLNWLNRAERPLKAKKPWEE